MTSVRYSTRDSLLGVIEKLFANGVFFIFRGCFCLLVVFTIVNYHPIFALNAFRFFDNLLKQTSENYCDYYIKYMAHNSTKTFHKEKQGITYTFV